MDVLIQRLDLLGALSAYADDLLLLIEGNARSELEQKGDLRDLDGLGVQYTDGDWTFSDVTASQERIRTLDRFAGLAFSRRQQLLNAQAAHGLGGFPIQAGRG
ncbi:GL20653 [Drosophila persimilis]|uniref:GL20653 n=1 Tax=Drosophila persimilis TaxID=7234 RepID=B4HD49_DROPE|nr:GL20653 [Drosophila persimilis]